MNYTLAIYSVKQEKLKEVKRVLRDFVAEVKAHEPRTLYLVFRQGASATFLHLMSFENEAARRRHAQARYVDLFVKKLSPLCLNRPTFTDLGVLACSRTQWRLLPH